MPRVITSLTLMICTYRRPQFFARCLASVASLTVPDGFRLTVAVADNNPASERDGYVGAALGGLSVPHVYGHQPEPGYSNARNLALDLALGTASEIFAFVDDDLVLAPDWLTGQIETYRSFDCDAVGGAVIGTQKVPPHGSWQRNSSMANFSFDRELVEANGLGLRFDPAKNLTGNEDLAFSQAATASGRRIVISAWPSVSDPSSAEAARADDLVNRAEVAIAMTRNRIVTLRKTGNLPGVALAAVGSVHHVLKAGGLSAQAALLHGLGNTAQARAKAISSWKEFGKFQATLAGLTGDVVPRQDVRRGK